MKKATSGIAATAAILALLLAGALWQLAFREPAVDLQPLPENLIPLTEVEGTAPAHECGPRGPSVAHGRL